VKYIVTAQSVSRHTAEVEASSVEEAEVIASDAGDDLEWENDDRYFGSWEIIDVSPVEED